MKSSISDIIVSIVLGSYNRKPLLKKAVDSIRNNGINVPFEIIVVDGGSDDGSLKWLVKQKDIITIVQHNRGFFRSKPVERKSWGYFINLGFKAAQGKYICMISDDCLLVPGSIKNGIENFEQIVNRGCNLGALAFYWRNTFAQKDYWVGLTLGNKMFINHGLFLRGVLEKVNWCEERLYDFYHADGDLCLKIWKEGFEIADCPTAFVEHFPHYGVSLEKNNLKNQRKDWANYVKKWSGVFIENEKSSIDDWKYLTYKDPYKTIRKFPIGLTIKYHFYKYARKSLNSAKNLIIRDKIK